MRETFEGENFRKLVKNTIVAEKSFADYMLLLRQRTVHSQILQRENSHKTVKIYERFLPWKTTLKVSRYMVVFPQQYS